MSKQIGFVGGSDPEAPHLIVSTSTAGVEVECDPSFVLRPDEALAAAALFIQAAQDRVAYAQTIAGEIHDPEKLVALIPGDPTSTRVVRRSKS